MQPSLLRILRNRKTPTNKFRSAVHKLTPLLVADLKKLLQKQKASSDSIVFVIILRSAIALLDPAIRAFPKARVAFAGLRRDEKTAIAHWYYENFPTITKQQTIVILDPMLATGGSATEVVTKVLQKGASAKKIYLACVIAAPEGITRLSKLIPKKNILAAAVDTGLDAKKFIVPGLGDFGDRYFGTTSL